jgi:hypothetical protein
MICNPVNLEGLFKYGRENPDFATFLSFVQVEYGLDYLEEQWVSFVDFKRCMEECPNLQVTEGTFNEFSQAMKELF